MKILIEITNDIYEHAKESTEDSNDEFNAMRAIAKGTPLTIIFDKIMDEIEQEAFHNANGVIYCGFTRVCKIIEKYKGGVDNGK